MRPLLRLAQASHSIAEGDLSGPDLPVKSSDEVFTLKWFAKFLNSLQLDNVKVHDPHSNVSTALIDNIEIVPAHDCIEAVADILNNEMGLNVLYCYPDEVLRNDTLSKSVASMYLGSSTVIGEAGRSSALRFLE